MTEKEFQYILKKAGESFMKRHDTLDEGKEVFENKNNIEPIKATRILKCS